MDMKRIPIRWAGLNHLALITNDLDTTTRFWHGVLDAPLVATIGNASFRHYFFDVGHGATVAFFEYRGHPVPQFAKPAGMPDKRAVQFDHVSLNLPDEAALLALRQRLLDHGCEVTDVVDHGMMQSIYFTDPIGVGPRSCVCCATRVPLVWMLPLAVVHSMACSQIMGVLHLMEDT